MFHQFRLITNHGLILTSALINQGCVPISCERPSAQAGLGTWHAKAIQSSQMMPFVFLSTLSDVAQHFVGFFCLLTHAQLMISDYCQQ